MYDPSERAAELRREAAADAARALVRLARMNVEHSDGPEAAAEFTRKLAERESRMTVEASFDTDAIRIVAVEQCGQAATAVVGVTLHTPGYMDHAPRKGAH
jgi:hypothetical protein